MTKQKILLIGATGFAGNHVMQKLCLLYTSDAADE